MTTKKIEREDINKELIEAINSLKATLETKKNGNGDYVTVIDGEGVTSKIEKAQFFQMLHSNVSILKRETNQLIEKVGDLSKSVNADLLMHGDISTKIQAIEKNMPRTFNSWLKDRSDTAKNMVFIFKLIFWVIVALFLIGNALPKLIEWVPKI